MKLIQKTRMQNVILFIEIICIIIFIVKCFGNCDKFKLDKTNLEQNFEGILQYFADGSVGIETESTESIQLFCYTLELDSGAYNATVAYDSDSRIETSGAYDSAGAIVFNTENEQVLKASCLKLIDGNTEMKTRFWIRAGAGTNSVKIGVIYDGNGKLAVKNIVIEEKREYRIITCIAVILLFVIIDLIYFIFISGKNIIFDERKKYIIFGIIGITIFSSLTYFTDFLYINWGHDLYFHLCRIVSLAEAFTELQIPNRIDFGMLNGYGYASPLYYGELFLVLPALLYNLYVPLQTCYQIFVVVVNFVTCIVCYWCFAKMTNNWKSGILGAAVYTLSSYRMTNVLIRAAVGEFTALIFFPLLVYGFWSIYNKHNGDEICINEILPIIIAVTGIINSHILSCEMIMVFVIGFIIIQYKKTFQKNILLALVKSGIFVVLLNLWFIVPFIQSMGMDIKVLNWKIGRIESSSVYLSQLFGIFSTAKGGDIKWGTKGEMPLSLGFPIVFAIFLFVVVYIKKETWHLKQNKDMYIAKICMIFGMISVLFASNLCKWDNLINFSGRLAQLAGIVQFPWRYLGIATIFFTVMLIFTLRVMEDYIPAKVCVGILSIIVIFVILTQGHFIMEYTNTQDNVYLYSQADVGTMDVGSGEYLLKETNWLKYKKRNVLCGDGVQYSEFHYDKQGKYYLTCINKNESSSYVDVPVQAYNNYQAYKSDGEELEVEQGVDSRVRINLPKNFDDVICLRYKVPLLWHICEVISGITLLIIIFLNVTSRRNGDYHNENQRK